MLDCVFFTDRSAAGGPFSHGLVAVTPPMDCDVLIDGCGSNGETPVRGRALAGERLVLAVQRTPSRVECLPLDGGPSVCGEPLSVCPGDDIHDELAARWWTEHAALELQRLAEELENACRATPPVALVRSHRGRLFRTPSTLDAMIASAHAGDWHAVIRYIETYPHLVDARPPGHEFSPIHFAASQGNTEAVRSLVKLGASPRLRTRGGASAAELLPAGSDARLPLILEPARAATKALAGLRLDVLRQSARHGGKLDAVADELARVSAKCVTCQDTAAVLEAIRKHPAEAILTLL